MSAISYAYLIKQDKLCACKFLREYTHVKYYLHFFLFQIKGYCFDHFVSVVDKIYQIFELQHI